MHINLHQANALKTTDDDFSRDKIYQSIHIAVQDYIKYLDSCINTLEKTNSASIQLQKRNKGKDQDSTTYTYELNLKDKSKKEQERILNQLYKNEIRILYSTKPTGNYTEDKRFELEILDRNEEEATLTFDFHIDKKSVYIKPNTSSLIRQKMALQQLKNQPIEEYTPLQKLFDQSDKAQYYFANNNNIPAANISAWNVLKDATRDGTDEQRRFVKKALNTKDFAILEGPPGSGKTTAIIEEITQHIQRGERVLLVSSTHVAVDNVLDRIINSKDDWRNMIMPLRIGDIGNIRKEDVKAFQLKNLSRKMKAEIMAKLANKESSKSRDTLLKCIKSKDNNEEFNDIILKSANLVAGTMIGILQHPDIKKDGFKELFDVMIVDESSKVTFLDFIVPALHAKKWVLVGDKNQLPPFSEDDYIVEYLRQKADAKEQKEHVRLYNIKRNMRMQRNDGVSIIFTNTPERDLQHFSTGDNYVITLNKSHNERILELNSADIILARDTKEIRKHIASHLKVKAYVFEGEVPIASFKARQQYFHKRKKQYKDQDICYPYTYQSEDVNWAEITTQKLSNMYQYRFDEKQWQPLKDELDELCPDEELKMEVEKIRKLAFPSILEMLQIGIGKTISKNNRVQNKIIYDGFNQFPDIKSKKFQTLSYQHRMQESIANVSRKYFYAGKNLLTANTVLERYNKLSDYTPNEDEVIWVSNPLKGWKKKNNNPQEVQDVKEALQDFVSYAIQKDDNYEVAILTFYRDQERLLRQMLQKMTKSNNKSSFKLQNIKINLCTVDKFQGDEADVVFLSFTVAKKRAFYNNPNRLNVALTRARYKLLLFGNKHWLTNNASSPALRELATEYDRRLKR